MNPKNYAKAITGAAIAGLGALGAAATDGVTVAEWCVIGVSVLTAFQGIYWVKNTPSVEG